MSRARELADAHWSYISDVLATHNAPDEVAEMIGFHYVTAMVHGYGHGIEDAETAVAE